jgi:hypothetical protein
VKDFEEEISIEQSMTNLHIKINRMEVRQKTIFGMICGIVLALLLKQWGLV